MADTHLSTGGLWFLDEDSRSRLVFLKEYDREANTGFISCIECPNEWKKHITLSAFHPPRQTCLFMWAGPWLWIKEDHILCSSWQHQFETAQLSPSAPGYNSITKDLMKFPGSALLLWLPLHPLTTEHMSLAFLFAPHHLDPSHTSGRWGWICLGQDWLLLLRCLQVVVMTSRGRCTLTDWPKELHREYCCPCFPWENTFIIIL